MSAGERKITVVSVVYSVWTLSKSFVLISNLLTLQKVPEVGTVVIFEGEETDRGSLLPQVIRHTFYSWDCVILFLATMAVKVCSLSDSRHIDNLGLRQWL